MHLQEMQTEFENLVWDKKGVEKQLRVAIKEHKMMALMLRELEDEHDEAIIKIEQLEDEVGFCHLLNRFFPLLLSVEGSNCGVSPFSFRA